MLNKIYLFWKMSSVNIWQELSKNNLDCEESENNTYLYMCMYIYKINQTELIVQFCSGLKKKSCNYFMTIDSAQISLLLL